MEVTPPWSGDDPAAPSSPGGRVATLDGLRGLAILGVMIFHQTCLEPATALDREFLWFTQFLQTGVDLFFVLSGYLITGILLDARGTPHYYRSFYARRILRIFPLYYAILVAGLIILPHFDHAKQEKWGSAGWLGSFCYWAFLSNWWIALRGAGPNNGLIDLSWTLSIEEQFYLVWPIMVRACGPGRLTLVCAGLIATAFLTRGGLIGGGAPLLWVHMMTPARWDALAVGALLALAGRRPLGLGPLSGTARRVVIGTGLVMVGLVLAMRFSFRAYPLVAVCGASVVAALDGGLLVIAVTTRPGSPAALVLGSAFLRTLGKYSYALYLFHNPIQALIRDRIYGPDQFFRLGGSTIPGQLLFYVVATVPTLLCARVSWRCFEGPILRLKRFFPVGTDRKRRPIEEQAAAADPGRLRADSSGVPPGDAEVALS